MQSDQAYSGVDNLEVMSEAVNYNRYLLNVVVEHAPPRARILDFGAGSGQFAMPLAQRGLDVTALEPDDLLRTRLAGAGLRAVGRLQELPGASFEYIYTLNVLEHIRDDVPTLEQLHSKLSNHGTLLIYVPAFPVLYTSMDARVGHVRRYTRQGLVRAVTAAGFDVREVAYVDSLGFLATLLFKWLGNKDGSVNIGALKLYDRAIFPLSRALDRVAQRWLGKNLLLVCRRRAGAPSAPGQ